MKRMLYFILTMLNVLSLGGCYDYHEINNTAMVAGIGIDHGKEFHYKVSVEVIRLSGGESSKPTAKVISEEGDNVEDCLKRLVNVATKELQFSHCKLILFSDSVTEEGLSDLVDAFMRDPQYRSDLFLAAVQGSGAHEMLSIGEKEERIASYDYVSVIENSYRETGSVPPTKLYQFSMDGDQTMLPLFTESDGKYSVDGTVSLVKGKKFGLLDLEKTQSVMLVSGEYRRGELLLTTEDGVEIPCQIRSVKASRRVEDGASLSVFVKLECYIRLTSMPKDFDLSTMHGVDAAEEKISALLSEKLESDWQWAKERDLCEVFGLSVYVYRHAPHLYDLRNAGERGRIIELKSECKVTLENFGFSDERISK
ncbi:MAG: Ger(x)C family spore germination protein [Clostridia bacterium]|nr:Ger(x)C family spore germination protein [Clostridia bacterium]